VSCEEECNPSFTSCTFHGNATSGLGGGCYFYYYSSTTMTECTFVGNSAQAGGGLYFIMPTNPVISETIIAFSPDGEAVFYPDGGSFADLYCCDFFGNAAGDWIGGISNQLGVNGNISEDPLFCDPDLGDFTLRNDSPCAPDNNDCGVLIGAWPVGCSTSAQSSRSWGHVKALY